MSAVKKLVSLLLFLFIAASATAMAQEQKDKDDAIKLKTDLVTLTASVMSRNGHPVKSLTKDDFVIYEDGVRQRITHFAPTEEPFTIMLLLDISGSTSNDIELIKRAAQGFLGELTARDRVAVIVFSRDIEMIAGFDQSRDRVKSALDQVATAEGDITQRFTVSTGTSFYDALAQAVSDSSFSKIEGRKAIVCMSDGVDSTSLKNYKQIAPLVEKSEASVYFLVPNTQDALLEGLIKTRNDPGYVNFSQSQVDRFYQEYYPDSADRSVPTHKIPPLIRREMVNGLYDIADRDMKQLAERTGGKAYPVNALTDLSAVYKQVADSLRSQYSIGYYPENETRDGRWRKIRVEAKTQAYTVRTRSGYWAK
jgi:VWFA-related protein